MQADPVTTQQPTGPEAVVPAGPQGAAQRRAADRDAVRAALLKGEDAAPANDKPKAEPAVEAKPDEPKVDAAPDEDDDEPAAAKPAAVEAKPDAETEKRLAAVQKAEARSREKLAAEKKALDEERGAAAKERAELEKARAEYAEFQKLRERAKVDPAAALRALGVEDLEYAAKQAYAAHKGDPGNKEAAARAMQLREQADEVAALKKRLDSFEQSAKERETQALVQQKTDAYIADVSKAAASSDAAPLAKHFIAKNPEKTRGQLLWCAQALLEQTGDIPDAADVLAFYEKNMRAELHGYGVDPDSILKTTPKVNDPKADKVTTAKTLGNDLSAPKAPRTRTSEREERAEVRKLLESGQLD